MALPASDNFAIAADPVGSNWTKAADALKAAAGRCDTATGNAGSEAHVLWGADAFNGDHFSECKAYNTAGAYGYGPTVRAVITGAPGAVIGLYWALIDSASTVTIYRQPGFTAVGTQFTGLTIADGDTWRLSVTGTTLTLSQNGASLGTRTDANLSGGSAGLGIYNARGTLDDFLADNVSAGGGAATIGNPSMTVMGVQ